MKIKRITVSNLKAVSNMTADFNGCTAIITGGNNKGKTSFLSGLMDRLRGLKPEKVVREGQSEMNAELELTTGEKFQWSIKDGIERLFYITSQEIKIPVTKAICEKYFPGIFDIDKFLNSTPKEQNKILQKLSGLDFTEIDTEYKIAYENRTFANRKREEEKAKCVNIDTTLPEKEQEIIIVDPEKHNESYKNANTLYEDICKQIENKTSEINKKVSEVDKLRKELEELENRKTTGKEWLDKEENKPIKGDKANELKLKLDEAKKLNEKIKKNNEAKEQKITFETADLNAKKADETVKEIETKKREMIITANLPTGFAFTEDGIEFNGLAITKQQLSSSGIYIAALKLAALKLGNVQTLHFDASHLDRNSLLEVEKWANEQDLQLLIERPDFEGGEIQYELIQN